MVKIIKLTNGVEVIGEIVEENHSMIVVKDPLQIHCRYYNSSVPTVILTKYILFAESDEITFMQNSIMNIVTPRESFEIYYRQSVDTNKKEFEMFVDKQLLELIMKPSDTEEFKKKIMETIFDNMQKPEHMN